MAVRSGVVAAIDIGGASLRVLRYALHEQLSEVGTLRCVLVNDDEKIPDPQSLVDQPAVLRLSSNDALQKRSFVGRVVAAERATDGDVQVVEVVVAPKAWRMSRRADCRVFQQLTAVEIVTKVLDGAGVDGSEWKVTGSYPKREYTVQYRETDLAFVARLLSEEGIYFAIQHADADTIVFGDDPTGLGPVDGNAVLGFRRTFGEAQAGETVSEIERVHEVRPDKTCLRDYDPLKPKVKLESTAKAVDGKGELEVYAYPGRFAVPREGDRLATVLLDSLRADRDLVSGKTGVLTLRPGARFSVEDHPYPPLNQEYLVVTVDIEGQDEHAFEPGSARTVDHRYACRFRAVPTRTVKYRPPRVVRERLVAEMQTAITTGPVGEEIHTDAHAQVKAQFHWDRLGKNDDKSSCWMRTSQLPTGGSMLLPRMGWEVAVRYAEGDVDRPVVMSRMYNAATPPPYELPQHKGRSSLQTATSPGGGSSNEVRMSDEKGKEEMFFNASKDMSVDVKNNTTESIGNNLTRNVGANHALSVTDSVSSSVGGNQTVSVAAQQEVHVQTFMVDQVGGNHTLHVGGARSMRVGGDHKREVGGDSTVKVGSLMIDLVVGSASEHVLGDHKHDVGAALVEMTAKGRSVAVAGDRAELSALAKIIGTKAGRGVEVSGSMNQKVGGAIVRSTKGDLSEKSGANFTEVAAGMQILKATNIQIEGETMVTLVMGASTIVMMPAMIAIVGASIKVDGEVEDKAPLVLDN